MSMPNAMVDFAVITCSERPENFNFKQYHYYYYCCFDVVNKLLEQWYITDFSPRKYKIFEFRITFLVL